MSENLKEIVNNGTLENTADIIAVTSVITQIVDALNGSQRSESEVHIFLRLQINKFLFPKFSNQLIFRARL